MSSGVLSRCLLVGVPALSLALVACTDDGTTPVGGGDAIPQQSGSFVGHYRVPVSTELEAAAIFPVDHVDWTVTGGVATLHYDLPVGLVGGALDVTFTGAIARGATEATLTSPAGTGTCTAVGTVISCLERFGDLGTLPISMLVVEQTAAAEYAGPVDDRRAVATIFGGPDPIGIVEFDVSQLAPDDGGSDD